MDKFIHFYSELLEKCSFIQSFDAGILRTGPILSDDNARRLVRDITRHEIKDALFSIGDEKSRDRVDIFHAFSKNPGILLLMNSWRRLRIFLHWDLSLSKLIIWLLHWYPRRTTLLRWVIIDHSSL